MTQPNRAANIAEELVHSAEAMRAAEALLALALYRDAANRLYYALYHATLAILLTEDLEPRSHQGALSLLGLHFIKPGKLPAELSATLRRIQSYREASDYTRGFVLTQSECQASFDAGRAYLQRTREFLTAAGYGEGSSG